MNDSTTALTYVIPEPFDQALRKLRSALAASELAVSSEMDLSGTMRRELGIRLNPARILYVHCPFLMLEAIALYAQVAVLMPLHVVLAARGPHTEVHVLNSLRFAGTGIPAALEQPVSKVQARIAAVLQRIAMRQGIAAERPSSVAPL